MFEKLFPTVSAQIPTRYVVNFACPPEELSHRLPVDWLAPQIVGGAAVLSLCFLSMRRAAPGAVPRFWGTSGDHCAVRWGIVDRRTGESAVWVERRLTGSILAHLSTRYGVPCTHPLARISIESADASGGKGRVESIWDEGRLDFGARFEEGPDRASPLFASAKDFDEFLHRSPRSFSVGNDGVSLNVVDLRSREATFSRVAVAVRNRARIGDRAFAERDVDSAFVTRDAVYTWRYVERIPIEPAACWRSVL